MVPPWQVTQALWIPGPLPGENEIIAAAKGFGGRGYGYSKLKRELTERIALLARAAKLRPMAAAHLTFEWREPSKRRDPDNFSAGGRKFALDGLVAAGVLPGDGWAHVLGFSETWTVDKSRPGVLVTLAGSLK